jgi:hypothetical protein
VTWFTELLNQVLRFAVSDEGVWVTAWVAVAFTFAMLILITRQITRPDVERVIAGDVDLLHHVRRHSRGGGFYATDLTVLLPRLPTSHWAVDVEWRDSQHPIDAPSTGKRSVHNPARTIVPADWMPPIGVERIRMLETTTVEVTEFRRLLHEGAI